MQLPFSLFLALRYLQPKRTFVSVITVISILGVVLGVMVLIVVISVMTGFDRNLQRAILGFEPHLRVTNGEVLRNWEELQKRVEQVPGVLAVAPYVQGPVLVEFEGIVKPAVILGIDVDQEQKLIKLDKYVKGSLDLSSDTVILGSELAQELGVGLRLDREVIVYAPGNIQGILEEIRREADNPKAKPRTLADLKQDIVIPAPLKVIGQIVSGTNSFDSTYLLVPLTNAQELYGLKDGIHGLAVKTADPYRVEETQRLINEALKGDAFTISWFQENRERFDAIRMERNVMYIILFFIVIVAAFGIMNTLITVTVQKTREIGVMKALGARTGQIIWVFLSQGMFVGALGTLSGLALGMTALHYRNDFRDWLSAKTGMEIFPRGIYEFDGIPAEIVPRDLATICLGAFAICTLASLIPAWFAARLDPVKALRTE